jgi:hypothetical protein
MTDLESFLSTHGVAKAKSSPTTSRAKSGGSSTMSNEKTVVRKPAAKSHKPKTTGTSMAPVNPGFPGFKGPSRAKPKPGIYKGTLSRRRVSLRKIGGLGGGFSTSGMEKFIKPGLLVTGGALAFKTIDKLFLKEFLEKNSATKNYPEEIKLALALAAGLGVAGFSKNNNVKLAALGVAVAQAIEYGSIKFVNALTTKATDPTKPSTEKGLGGLGGLGGLDGLRRINAFGTALASMPRNRGAVAPGTPPAAVEFGNSGDQFAV